MKPFLELHLQKSWWLGSSNAPASLLLSPPFISLCLALSIFLFLSFSHPSIYLHNFLFCFTIHNQIGFEFIYAKKISVATTIWTIYHILTDSLDPDNTKWWVGYYFYSYLFIPWGWFYTNPQKTNESHTKHSNFIKRLILFLFNPIEL